MADEQMDIFGNFVPVDSLKDNGKETIKQRFRRMYGYDYNHTCGTCRWFAEHVRQKTYFKCHKMGVSSSDATDIRKKDIACRQWEEE